MRGDEDRIMIRLSSQPGSPQPPRMSDCEMSSAGDRDLTRRRSIRWTLLGRTTYLPKRRLRTRGRRKGGQCAVPGVGRPKRTLRVRS